MFTKTAMTSAVPRSIIIRDEKGNKNIRTFVWKS